MKKITIILVILVSIQIYSQKTKIQILNFKDNNPIENVQIYSDSILIDKTDSQGFFNINLKKNKKISIIKEDFYDTIINLKNTSKILLKKINAVQLKEVVITNININYLLDSISDKRRLKNVNISNYTHFYNILTINMDTLLYLNNRLYHKNREGYFCSAVNKIIGNFRTNENLIPVFEYKKKPILFHKNYLHFSDPYFTTELQIITKLRKYFDYKVTKDNEYYKIEFTQNKKNNEFPYNGYILIDYEDFGIYEFKINTNKQKDDIRTVLFDKELLQYKIFNEEIFIKYIKNENGKYDMVSYNFDNSFEALNGNFKGSVFINKCRIEPTLYFDNSKMSKIDLTTYKFIQ